MKSKVESGKVPDNRVVWKGDIDVSDLHFISILLIDDKSWKKRSHFIKYYYAY